MQDSLTGGIIGSAIEVHRTLGPGLLETIYEQALCYELVQRKLKCERQVAVDVIYKGLKIAGQKIDLLVEDQVVVELKCVRQLPEVATAQTLSYLKSTKLSRALLINFAESKLIDGVHRISL